MKKTANSLRPMPAEQDGYRSWLTRAYQKRKSRNASYSLRAFARDLGVGKTTLSDVLAGNRHLSPESALQVADKLGLSPVRTRKMLREIGVVSPLFVGSHLRLVQEDLFRSISDWYHYALLSVAELESNSADAKWIGKVLGIEADIAAEARDRLVRLGLLEVREEKLYRTTAGLTTPADRASEALKKYHRQNLELALKSLVGDPVDRRDFSSTTLAIDPSRLPEAKEAIRQFRRTMAGLLEEPSAKAVYLLAVQLFPLTREEPA